MSKVTEREGKKSGKYWHRPTILNSDLFGQNVGVGFGATFPY
jgi:hypothetical protein